MTDQLLLVSRIALLALVYLVFLRVARAVIVEIRAESRVLNAPMRIAAAPTKIPSTAAMREMVSSSPRLVEDALPGHLTIVEPGSIAGTAFALSPETTIGRALGCGVMIDDARISKLHARVFSDGSQWMIEDLGSTNGTKLNGRSLTSPSAISKGDRLQVGEVVMELS